MKISICHSSDPANNPDVNMRGQREDSLEEFVPIANSDCDPNKLLYVKAFSRLSLYSK